MKTLSKKSGVTLTVLAITVVVMVILASTIIINVGDSVTDTKKATFASDLKTIEDAVSIYYVQNDELPSDKNALSEKEILSLSGNDNMTFLKEELSLNGDDNENLDMGSFYKINLSKLDIETSTRGTLVNGENDVYVVSFPSLKVYYLAGLSADSTKYFSLSSKITSANKLEETEQMGINVETDVQTVSGVTVKKQVKTWTNDANILIQANIASTEKLYVSVAGREKRAIETKIGNNNLSFGSLEDIKNGKANIKADITESDIEYFNSLSQSEKIIYIIKEKNGEMTANVKVDLSNFENVSPVILNIKEIQNDNYNIIEFSVNDSISGVKNIYYEYLKCYDEDMNLKNYYTDVTEYDASYMKARGKKVEVTENNTYQVKVPKNITKVQITAFDKALNYTSVSKELNDNIYATVLGKNISNKSVYFNFAVLFKKEISSVKTYISTNGIDFEDEKNIDITNIEENELSANVVYDDVLVTTQDVYVKIVVTTKENEEYVRIINLSDIEDIEIMS